MAALRSQFTGLVASYLRTYGLQTLPYSERLRLTGLEQLEARRIRTDLIFAYKLLFGYTCLYIHDVFRVSDYSTKTRGHPYYLTLDLSSYRIQMAASALGHTLAPFCFVVRQFLGFFRGQVHLSEVSFDDIYQVLPRSSWFSLVTSQFPVCCLTSCPRLSPFSRRVQAI